MESIPGLSVWANHQSKLLPLLREKTQLNIDKIESENDLPKYDCTVFVKVKQLNEPFICNFLVESKDFVETMIYTEDVTHYQPIITPKPPLY